MTKLNKDFFTDNEVLFVGYSGGKNKVFVQGVHRAFVKHGLKVYPMNPRKDASFDVKVYRSFDELPKVPASAFVLLSKENAKKAIKELKERGVKKILFQSKRMADRELLDQCKALGLETAVACPMMVFGGGFHKFHGFLAGVRKP